MSVFDKESALQAAQAEVRGRTPRRSCSSAPNRRARREAAAARVRSETFAFLHPQTPSRTNRAQNQTRNYPPHPPGAAADSPVRGRFVPFKSVTVNLKVAPACNRALTAQPTRLLAPWPLHENTNSKRDSRRTYGTSPVGRRQRLLQTRHTKHSFACLFVAQAMSFKSRGLFGNPPAAAVELVASVQVGVGGWGCCYLLSRRPVRPAGVGHEELLKLRSGCAGRVRTSAVERGGLQKAEIVADGRRSREDANASKRTRRLRGGLGLSLTEQVEGALRNAKKARRRSSTFCVLPAPSGETLSPPSILRVFAFLMQRPTWPFKSKKATRSHSMTLPLVEAGNSANKTKIRRLLPCAGRALFLSIEKGPPRRKLNEGL